MGNTMTNTKSEFKYHYDHKPDFSFLTITVPADKTIKVEATSMATMDTNMQMKTKMKGGFKRILTGESLFINEFTAEGAEAEIGIAPSAYGDMSHFYLDGHVVYLQGSAFVASGMDIVVESKWQGWKKALFSGERMFLIKCSGKGDLWFNSYGGIVPVDIDGDYVIDTGHIVAFTDGLEYKISKVGNYKSLFFSGEGFVCRFSGKGKAWIQTRKLPAFTSWVYPYRPTKSD